MESDVQRNQEAWQEASTKHIHEYEDLLAQARHESSLTPVEQSLLAPLLTSSPAVVHLQSGHGLDDIALLGAGARSVVGVDFSAVAATSAQRRADELRVNCRYVISEVPAASLREQCADLVYTGKGALIWMPDLTAWAVDVARLLRPGGHLFVFEAHPAVPLWTWDEDEPRIRADRDYFAASHVNDTFPAHGAREWQWTLGQIVTAVTGAGLQLRHLAEHPDPFWRPSDASAAAWRGRLPNTFSLLAVKPAAGEPFMPPAGTPGR